jgi:hypothetical protein
MFAGCANRHHLRMRRRIIRRSDAIGSFRDDLAVFHDDGREGASSPGTDILERKLDRASHE